MTIPCNGNTLGVLTLDFQTSSTTLYQQEFSILRALLRTTLEALKRATLRLHPIRFSCNWSGVEPWYLYFKSSPNESAVHPELKIAPLENPQPWRLLDLWLLELWPGPSSLPLEDDPDLEQGSANFPVKDHCHLLLFSRPFKHKHIKA